MVFRTSLAAATAVVLAAAAPARAAMVERPPVLVPAAAQAFAGEKVGWGNGGQALALSADGSTAVVAAAKQPKMGAWVFVRAADGTWSQQGGRLVGSESLTDTTNTTTTSAALSADGNTLLLGNPRSEGGGLGTAVVFTRSGTTWTQQSYLDETAPPADCGTYGGGDYGWSVALSADGSTAVVGSDADACSGSVWVFTRSGSTWTQQAKITRPGGFAHAVAVSGDGSSIVVSGSDAAWLYDRPATGWSGTLAAPAQLTDASAGGAGQGFSVAISSDGQTIAVGGQHADGNRGAAWIYARGASGWAQQAKLADASYPLGYGIFQGYSVALSADGNTLLEGGSGSGYQGLEPDGAAWRFTRNGGTWSGPSAPIIGTGTAGTGGGFGDEVALDARADTALVTSPEYNLADSTAVPWGAVWVYDQPPVITAVSPAGGPAAGGTTVTITGSDLGGATGVRFGSAPATSFTVDSDTQITATAPAGSGTVDVAVTSPHGDSSATAGDRYAYAAAAPMPAPTTTTSTTTPSSPTVTTSFKAYVAAIAPAVVQAAGRPASAIAKLGSISLLDAGATRGASTYDWTIDDGAQKIVEECPGSDPVLSVQGLPAGDHPVTLQAFDDAGLSATATGYLLSKGLAAKAAHVDPVTTCARSTSAETTGILAQVDAKQIAAFESKCVDDTRFATVDAEGCTFAAKSEDAVPVAERSLLNYVDGGFVDAVCGIVHSVCGAGRDTGAIKQAAVTSWNVMVAAGPLKINGLRFVPRLGAHIVLAPELGQVVSSFATVYLGDFPVYAGPVNLNVDDPSQADHGAGGGSASILNLDAGKLPVLGGFHFNGYLKATFVHDRGFYVLAGGRSRPGRYHTNFTAFLQLPGGIAAFGDNPPSAGVDFSADNQTGFSFDHLRVDVPQADLGPLQVTNLSLEYMRNGDQSQWWDPSRDQGPCSHNWWKGTLQIRIGDWWVNAAPPPPEYGIAFCDGHFANGGLTIQNEIVPDVTLDGGFDLRMDPITVFHGSANVTAKDLLRVHADVLVAYGTADHPYVLDDRELSELPSLQPIADELGGDPEFDSTTIAVGGEVYVALPVVGETGLGGGYMLYQDPAYWEFGGWAHFSPLSGVDVDGALDFKYNSDTGAYYGHGRLTADLPWPIKHVGVYGAVSNRGFVGCADIDGWKPGVGYRWGGRVHIWSNKWWLPFDSDACDPNYVYVDVPRSRLAQVRAASDVAGTFTFTVAPHETEKEIELTGVGDAPSLTVTDPGGETSTTDVTQPGAHLMTVRWPQQSKTYVFVKDARPGTYTVALQPGSVPIANEMQSQPIEHRPVRGTLRRVGAREVLTYDAGSLAHRQVTFLEQGAGVTRTIGVATHSRGTISFTPASTQAETRQILASITVDDVPPSQQLVASFHVAAPRRPVAPASLRVVRRRKTLTVRWPAVANATAYRVTVRLRGGRIATARLAATRRVAKITGVPPTEGGSVTVRSIGAMALAGGAARATFKAHGRQRTAMRPFSDLRTHTWRHTKETA